MINSWLSLQMMAAMIVAFATTYTVMPSLIRALTRVRLTSRDLHKTNKSRIPIMGGIGVFCGFASAMTISATSTFDHRLLFAIFLSATMAVLAGIIDDLFKLGKTTLIIITFLIGMPIVTFRAGSTLVYLTPFGPADLGWIFWALVPFVFAFLMNGVNIYAGFNGLEAGLGATSSMTLGICAFLYGSLESAVSLFALGAALLAFLRWNWYPAKVFIGGSGTFLIGSVLASSIIVGSIKVVGVIALFPYLINFTLRAIDRFDWSVGETWSNGIVTSARRNALWALFMYRKHTSEKRVTLHCICFHIFFSLGAIIYAYYHTRIVLL